MGSTLWAGLKLQLPHCEDNGITDSAIRNFIHKVNRLLERAKVVVLNKQRELKIKLVLDRTLRIGFSRRSVGFRYC